MRRALASLLLCTACNTHVFSPPAGSFPIESAATVGAGRKSVGVDLAFASPVFGPSFSTYRASYRHGLGETLEVSAAPSMIWIAGSSAADSHPGIYAVRAALKYAPIPHVAAAFGLGTGASAAGAFVSPDLGVTLAWENPYLVPFASARAFFSAPIAARRVHFTTGDDADEHDPDSARDAYFRTPRFSYGVQFGFGLRVPLWRDRLRKLRPALNCALGGTAIYDRAPDKNGMFGFGCGADLGF